MMRFPNYLIAVAATTGLLMGVAQAEPGGCLKYGAVGAVGGHLAHHHAVLGAAAGCGLGMYKRHEYKKHMRLQQEQGAAAYGDSAQ
jgi:hypothetical protein